MHYIGLDVHKESVSYCVKTAAGEIVEEGRLEATRDALQEWAEAQPALWQGALEATPFSGWIHDTLAPYADDLALGHPAAMEAITRAKKKSDRIDAAKIADLLRANLLPRAWPAPRELRELRRLLRFRRRLVEQSTWNKNRIATALMELGQPYLKTKIHTKRYFYPFLDNLDACDTDVLLLTATRDRMEDSLAVARLIEKRLLEHPLLAERTARLRTIPGVGAITALTWALEIGVPSRFASIDRAVSYCGLCAGLNESAGKAKRGPLSRQRNAHLQHVLIEAAKLAPRWNDELARLHAREIERGHRNRATIQVARKLVALLLAVDRRGTGYEPRQG